MTDTEDAPVVEEPEVTAEAEAAELGDEEQAIVNDEEPSDSSTEKKEPKGVQKRIDELTRNWRDTERDRDYWRELAVKSQTPTPEPVKAQPVKTLADFEYDEAEYQTYLFDQAKEVARQVAVEERNKNTQVKRQSNLKAQEDDFSKTADDYYSVTRNPAFVQSEAMMDVIQESDIAPAILYHLAKNPDINQELLYLPPHLVGREIGRIEAKISLSKPEKSVSKAPPPTPKIQAVEPSVNVNPTSPDSDNISTEEWLKRRNKQIAKG